MKKFICSILILICIFTLGKYILNNTFYNTYEKDKTSIYKNYSSSKEKNETETNIDNKEQSDNTLSDLENKNENKNSNNILVTSGENEYIVAFDQNTEEVVINENISNSDKYIKLDYKEILPVLKNIDDPKSLSIPEYISLYKEISPYISTNMSSSELLSLASSIDINDLKSSYNKFIKIQKNNG